MGLVATLSALVFFTLRFLLLLRFGSLSRLGFQSPGPLHLDVVGQLVLERVVHFLFARIVLSFLFSETEEDVNSGSG